MSPAASALKPVPRPGAMKIEAYVPGKSKAPPGVKLHKLSSNETPLGASPQAIAAFKASADALELYPDGSSTALARGDCQPLRPRFQAHCLRCGFG